jgi:tRNA A37 threonylcarbamoyladenosine synthetase subunit TsaC/SUA5/YrdC
MTAPGAPQRTRPLDLDATCVDGAADAAFDVVADGGLVLLRTVVGYGLVGVSDDAIRRMYDLKGRPDANPLIVVGTVPILDALTLPLPARARRWLDDIVTRTTLAVVNDVDTVSPLYRGMSMLARTRGLKDGSAAVFLNTGWLPERLATRMAARDTVLLGTSANQTGQGNSQSLNEVPERIRGAVDHVYDQGPALYRSTDRLATTIVDLRRMTVTRLGVSAAAITADLRRIHAVAAA